MFNLRNVRPLAIVAGAGAGAVGLPFLHDLITHPIAGGIYLLAGCALTVKAQQHSADKAEQKAAEQELKAMAKAERKYGRRADKALYRQALPPAARVSEAHYAEDYGSIIIPDVPHS